MMMTTTMIKIQMLQPATQKIFGRKYMPNACLMYSSTTTPQVKEKKIKRRFDKKACLKVEDF